MVSWDKFIPLLAPHVSTAPDATLKAALAASAAEFFAETHLWVEEIDPVILIAGVPVYELFAPAAIDAIPSVVLENCLLRLISHNAISPARWDDQGHPSAYWVLEDGSIRLWPVPEEGGKELRVRAVLKNALSASGVPSWLFETWGEAIVDGAIWRLAQIPEKTWSDKSRAAQHKMLYDRAKANAIRRTKQYVPLRVQQKGF